MDEFEKFAMDMKVLPVWMTNGVCRLDEISESLAVVDGDEFYGMCDEDCLCLHCNSEWFEDRKQVAVVIGKGCPYYDLAVMYDLRRSKDEG